MSLPLFFSSIRHTCTTQPLTSAHTILEQNISSSGISKDSILYLDGPFLVEKQPTTATRELRRTRSPQNALTSIADLEQHVERGYRVRRRQFSALNKHIRAAFYWPLDARENFTQHMCTRG
jgi:hypothetical protein